MTSALEQKLLREARSLSSGTVTAASNCDAPAETRAVEPLERPAGREAVEPPETCPTAL